MTTPLDLDHLEALAAAAREAHTTNDWNDHSMGSDPPCAALIAALDPATVSRLVALARLGAAGLDVDRLDAAMATAGVHVDLRRDAPRPVGCESCKAALSAIAAAYAATALPAVPAAPNEAEVAPDAGAGTAEWVEWLEDQLAMSYVRDRHLAQYSRSFVIAELCDEFLDRSGAMLGHVRDKAAALRERRP